MARKATDLLDVFRFSSDAPKGSKKDKRAEKRRERSEASPGSPTQTRAPRARFEGIFLPPRQMLLGGSVLVLLLALSFTVGLGVGRSSASPTAPDASGPSLRRETYAWALRGEIPKMDVARAEAPTETRIVRELGRKYGVPSDKLRVDAKGDPVVIWVGPFETEEAATAFLAARNLGTARLWSAAPFRFTKPQQVRLR
jgi:hypothetical protein